MIPATGTKIGESYEAAFGKRRDVTIKIVGERGQLLAKALGARCAMSLQISQGVCYHFTPGRSKKWYRLWMAGFSVHSVRLEGVTHWRYNGLGQINLKRNEAVALVHKLETERAKAQATPPPPPQITLCPPTKIN